MAMADVTVMGAGIFGLCVAWTCAARGARVQVIDPGGPGAGASGGLVGALAPHVPDTWNAKKAFQRDSLLMARDFWEGVRAASGRSPGYARTGRLQPIADADALERARARAQGAATLWQRQAEWRVIAACDAPHWAPETPSGYLIHDTLTARLHPRLAGAALCAAIRGKGGTIRPDGRPEGRVLWATGVADLAALGQGRARAMGAAVKGQAALLRHEARDAPQIFAEGVHIVPHEDGTLAVGSTSERDFDDPVATDARLDAVLERAFAALPALRAAPVLERWAGLRPRARSRAPMLGAHPLHPGQFIANGGFKIGFGMAPMVGAVMADLMLEGRDRIPADFRPEASL